MPFSNNRNSLLCEYFINIPIFGMLLHILVKFFSCPYIINLNFVCPSVNQSMYMLTLKQSGLQFQNLDNRDTKKIFGKTSKRFFEKSI